MKELTPREIVRELDRYIIGQDEAKRMVAIALRNRYRRSCLDEEMRSEISPKNILMIGPTGVGKTEIARRLAKLVKAPFVKVEATKFTEVGYVGRDVESIIRDLMENSIRMVRKEFSQKVETRAQVLAEDRLAELLVNPPKKQNANPLEMLLGKKRTKCPCAGKMCCKSCAPVNWKNVNWKLKWKTHCPSWKWAAIPSTSAI